MTVAAADGAGLERLARYLLRPPLSLERLHLEPGLALYHHKRTIRHAGEAFDPVAMLARLLMYIPAPRLHLVPGSSLEIFVESSHMTMLEQPQRYLGVLREFLRESEDSDDRP